LPDGGFLRQIWTILADLKVVWRAKYISGGFPITGGFLADLINTAQAIFCLADLAVLESLLAKSSFDQTLSCNLFFEKNIGCKILFLQNILQRKKNHLCFSWE
jgi:hypothetical protein